MGKSIEVNEYRTRWSEGICFDPRKDIATNFLDELEVYSKLPRYKVEQLFYHGIKEFAKEWEEKCQNHSADEATFYNESLTQIFFVMYHNAMRIENNSPLLYVYASDWVKRLKLTTYLDYGTGTGSGAMFFARQGIKTTAADISSQMLDFTKWRFEKRGLSATYLDLKQNTLPKKAFDLITCFHVLQIVEDPVALMRQMRDALTEKGILVVNGALRKDPEYPMQPDHGGQRTTRKFRSVGLQILWDQTREMRQLSNTNPQMYQRVERSSLVNTAYLMYDTTIVSPSLRRLVYLANRPLRKFFEKGSGAIERKKRNYIYR